MTAQFARTPYRGRSGGSTAQEPHAALLIDFDNVTMGIRSDLTKELKNLLNSDIIKGKVAVQRAYADWRRYPQYIVPLAESSVDLIFAPAYGSAKKNATDIRLAIDAVELVFTRPEIGTIILLSGDSDFSSLVLKLKEYGKYVIGVGIRESASDLLVQNCDEYYSYSALTGLTRAGEEAPVVSDDPWELVEVGLRQMIENDDVMRSDRLKQVLLEMDPGFDEKALGFQKFNKFLQEAANRGIISLRKQENGQYEVGPPSEDAVDAAGEPTREARESRSRRGRRGRGRREEREPRESRDQLEMADTQPAERDVADVSRAADVEQPAAAAAAPAEPVMEPSVEPEAAAEIEAPAPEKARGRRAPAARQRTPDEEPPASDEPAAAAAVPATAQPSGAPSRGRAQPVADGRTDGVAAAYDLLRRAVTDLVRKGGPAVRDSDVKRRMLELQAGWDEASLGFSKFSRFLRTAHDAEVVTLRRGENGVFDVLLGDGGVHVESDRDERGGRRDRGRGRGRDSRETRERERRPEREPAEVAAGAGAGQADEAAAPATTQATRSAPAAAATAAPDAGPSGAADRPAAGTPRETQATPPATAQPAQKLPERTAIPAAGAAVGFRRGSRGRPAPGGPPPLLEGQAAPVIRSGTAGSAGQTEAPQAAGAAAPQPGSDESPGQPSQAARETAEKGAKPARQRGGAKPAKAAKQAAAEPQKQPAAKQAPQKQGRTPAKDAGGRSPRGPALDPVALGLPTDPAAIVDYISTNYKGVGPKSVQTLIDEFGADKLYDALEKQHDRIRELMGNARGETLIDAWADDIAARRANAAPDSRSVVAKQAAAGGPRRPAKKGRGPAAGGGPGGKGGPGARGGPGGKGGPGGRRGPRGGRPAGK